MNFLALFILSFSSLIAAPDSSGWVALEKPIPYVEEEIADREGIWAVFSKQIGKESFTVRFPDDPVYRYFGEGIEIFSVKDSEKFHLFISEIQDFSTFEKRLEAIEAIPGVLLVQAEKISSDTFDLSYKADGKWVQERLFFTSSHAYTMQTTSLEFGSENHRFFIDSLYVKSQF